VFAVPVTVARKLAESPSSSCAAVGERTTTTVAAALVGGTTVGLHPETAVTATVKRR
jgi:hypothetical protein